MFSIVVLAAVLANAQAESSKDSIREERWRGTAGDLAAIMVFTDQPESFLKEWSQPVGATPQISSVDIAHRGDTRVAFILFSGCKPRNGSCNLEVDFRLLKPDGSVYAEEVGIELWKGKPPPPVGYLQLSVANLGFRVESQDPFGEYMLKVVVHDRVAKLDLALERELEVLSAK